MKRTKSDETLDRLSKLPDSLILQILSFLTMRDVVRTTLLSKRWINLWTTIPCLDFNESMKNPVKTRNFNNRVLLSWNGTNIRKFSINFSSEFDSSLSVDMDFWLRFATGKRLEELLLYLPLKSNIPVYELPQCVYSCSSITYLLLRGCKLQIRGNVEWDQLKSLTLHGLCFGEDVINQVVSSSPRLEILNLFLSNSRDQNLSIRSSSLKKLIILKYLVNYNAAQYDPSRYAALTISAPKLESLSISGAAYRECLLMDIASLTEAKLVLYDLWDVAIGKTLRQILPTIQHVDALTLSPFCFKMLGVLMRGKCSFLPFLNVKLLKFCGGPIDTEEIVDLAVIFPKVEKLRIDWKTDGWYPLFLAKMSSKQDIGDDYLKSEANKLKSFLMLLRSVEVICSSNEVASIFQFIKCLLKHATKVKKVVIRQRGGEGLVQFEGLEELQSLLRSFPTIDLIFCKK